MSCASQHRQKLAYNASIPIGINDSLILPVSITFYKTNYKDVVIYELPRKRTNEVNGVLVLDTMMYDFFIYTPGDVHGLYLKSINDEFITEDVDSVLTKFALKTLSADPLEPYIVNAKKQIIDENQFVIRNQVNFPPIDSVYFYFDKRLRKINHSYSKKLDSLYDAKLFRIEYLVKKYTTERASFINDQRLTYFEVRPVRNDNYKEMDTVYKRFKALRK